MPLDNLSEKTPKEAAKTSLSEGQRDILRILADKTALVAEVAEEAELAESIAQLHLTALVEREFIRKVLVQGKAYFTLTPRGKQVLDLGSQDICEKAIIGKKYTLEALLGEGTYGQVWKATDRSLERTVAVKLLHGGVGDFEQLKTEAKAIGGLTHKNILIVHELNSDQNNGWLVTEFIDGPSLHEHLGDLAKSGKWLSIDEAKRMVAQCLEALEFAHDKSRVHGDIKPANILVSKTGEIKLGDFGVAKILGASPEEKREYSHGHVRRLGSSSYAAPEVLKGQPRDFQSDLFSIGILAYILLTGNHPFIHKSGLVSVQELIRSDTFVPPKPSDLTEDIPEKYDKIVMRLLEKDKSKRFLNAREALDQWREKVEMVQCLKCNTENPVLNKFCGQCGAGLGAVSKAKTKSERSLSTSFALFTAGRTSEAIGIMREYLDKNPKYSPGWAQLGYMLNFERRYEEAEDACTTGIQFDSESSRLFQTRGFARSNLGKFEEAIKDFTIALDKESDNRRKSMILYQRGYSRKLSGDFEGAYEDSTLAFQLDDTNVKANKLRESLEPLVK